MTHSHRLPFDLPFPCERKSEPNNDWQYVQVPSKDFVPKIVLCLPKYMQSCENENEPIHFFSPWVSYGHSQHKNVELRVYLAIFDRDVDPGQLLKQTLFQQNASIVNAREQIQPYGTDCDLLATLNVVTANQAIVSRNLCQKFGKAIFWFQVRAPRDKYPEFANDLWEILNQMSVKSLLGDFSEDIATFNQQSPMPIKFYFPGTWATVQTEVGNEVCHISVENRVRDTVVARINVVVQHGGESTALVARYENVMRGLGLEVSDTEFVEVNLGDQGNRLVSGPNRLQNNASELEYAAMFFKYDESWIWFDYLTFPESESTYWWLVCQRAFQIVSWSLELDNSAVAAIVR